MSYSVVWSFRNRVDTLINSIKTADKNFPVEVDFVLVDAASDIDTLVKLRTFCNTLTDRVVRICESTYRSSLSEAWNLGCMLTKNRYIIFASSDVIFLSKQLFPSIVEALKYSEYVLVNNHAVFALDKSIIPKIGWFDEGFQSGPHFDPDYMIRASEKGIQVLNIPNNSYYTHGDEGDATMAKERLNTEVKDRLPMNNFHNEDYFKLKWSSNWPGWRNAILNGEVHMPHPPTHISQVSRNRPEVDPHPAYTSKYEITFIRK